MASPSEDRTDTARALFHEHATCAGYPAPRISSIAFSVDASLDYSGVKIVFHLGLSPLAYEINCMWTGIDEAEYGYPHVLDRAMFAYDWANPVRARKRGEPIVTDHLDLSGAIPVGMLPLLLWDHLWLLQNEPEISTMSFNADQFLDTSYNEAAATERKMIPEGDYLGTISDKSDGRDWEKISAKSGITTKTNDDGSSRDIHWMLMKVPFRVTAPHVPEADGRLVSATIFLDVLQPDDPRVASGARQPGELDFEGDSNVALGKLRAAVGQNEPGMNWNPRMLANNQAVIHVVHETNRTNGNRFPAVTAVAKYEGTVPGQ